MLKQAGWVVQDRDRFNLYAGQGVVIREFSMSTGAADWLILIPIR
jgi:type I restriction enzyme R subunit